MVSPEDQHIQVRLTCTEEEHSLEQNVFSLSSKSSCTELQDLLKNLLDLSESEINFTFQIGDKILQNSVGKYCEENNFSGESELEIKYFETLKVPEESAVITLDDWIGGVAIGNQYFIYAGLYNGHLAKINSSADSVHSPEISLHSIHEKPIKSVAFLKEIQDSGESKDIILTSSLDHSLCFSLVGENSLTKVYDLKGHTATVTSSSVSPSTEQIASGSWDTYLKVSYVSISHDIYDYQHVKHLYFQKLYI